MQNDLQKKWREHGYCVIEGDLDNIDKIAVLFEEKYKKIFSDNIENNRNLLKCFSNDPLVKKLFLNEKLFGALAILKINYPIFTGPIVTHYTSLDLTGNGYSLKMHQDWPSMATSDNGAISWVSLFDTNINTHGIIIAPGTHKNGCLPGTQKNTGYLIEDRFIDNKIILEIKRGDWLLMHPWLAHSTYINYRLPKDDFKLSLSTRFDDLDDKKWADRKFQNAYKTYVDRNMWLST